MFDKEHFSFSTYIIPNVMYKGEFMLIYLPGAHLTCCSITTRATAAWTTLVLSRQSIQLTLKIPSCLQITPA